MAMMARDVKEWLDTVQPDSAVAIDDGGLRLVEVRDPDCWLEVGGLPQPAAPGFDPVLTAIAVSHAPKQRWASDEAGFGAADFARGAAAGRARAKLDLVWRLQKNIDSGEACRSMNEDMAAAIAVLTTEDVDALRDVILRELDSQSTPTESLQAIAQAAGLWPKGEALPTEVHCLGCGTPVEPPARWSCGICRHTPGARSALVDALERSALASIEALRELVRVQKEA